ncbi:sigma-70 family RNA polymerase sigma factor [Parabacteroides sp. OttesenSCG-928-J18]|nr:sigma-70 family RNA polymerase sigma factor [Parabacteroides sp. OttesenSCG-928-J18]
MRKEDSDRIIHAWEQLRKSDRDALALFFRLTSDLLYRYGMKLCVDEELVKDCMQELYVKIFQTAESLPALENPLFYLFKGLKNRLFNAIEQKERITYYSPQEIQFQADFYYEAEGENDSIDDEMREKFEKLYQCLSDRQKEAIYLRFQMDMTYEEISQLLGINYQSARNLVYRTLEKIRTEFASLYIYLFF